MIEGVGQQTLVKVPPYLDYMRGLKKQSIIVIFITSRAVL